MVKDEKAPAQYDKVVKTLCKMCWIQCGMNAYVKDGKVIKVTGMKEHPMNQGELCVKGEHSLEWLYNKERLQYPQLKVNGKFEKIGWDKALDILASKIKEGKQKYGDDSLIFCFGDPVGIVATCGAMLGERFCDAFGTRYRSGPNTYCYVIRGKAALSTMGKFENPDAEESKCIILWGHNPQDSIFPYARLMNNAIKKGAKLIVIDPRRTEFAKQANIHAQPRPGSDCALGLAFINVIIEEKLYDKEFVDKWCYGFKELAERVKEFTPENAEKITWVPANKIREMARLFAKTKPACIVQGTNTLDQQASGFQNSRIVLILQALTANIDNPGGSIRVSGNLRMNPIRLPDKVKNLKLVGTDKYPIAYQLGETLFGESQTMEWPDHLVNDKVHMAVGIIHGANPLVTYPNTPKITKALEKIDFLVVMDLFMSETARTADLVLPAASFFETTELSTSAARLINAPFSIMRKKAIEPLYESWPDWKFWFELGKRCGYSEFFPWGDINEYLDNLLKPMEAQGISAKRLLIDNPEGISFGAKEYGEYPQKGFRTPSGKIEFSSQMVAALGHDPLPYYTENPESPYSTPELAKKYPIVLTTGAREKEFWHSMMRQVPDLLALKPEPSAVIHPDTAKKYGITNGDMIVVKNMRGSIDIRAKVTEDIMPGVIVVPHGWAKANINMLTDNKHADPISGYPIYKGLLCAIEKKK
jgi:formate dehydrogenase (coenzyme F420) alpha subunit